MALLLTWPGWAESASDDPTSGDVVLFPGPLRTVARDTQAPGPGWDLPGRNFKSGSGWWVLSCQGKKGCALAPTQLKVQPLPYPQYDGPMLPGQFLMWSPMPAPDEVVAVFKPIRALAGMRLKSGPLTTWLHFFQPSYPQPPSMGTMEVLIPGVGAVLRPRWVQSPLVVAAAPDALPPDPLVQLELRLGQQRQNLIELDTGTAPGGGVALFKPRDYLVWAGDLDGDGKLDLIINRGGGTVSTRLALFLSSLAQPGELVGLAGLFEFNNPSVAGC